MPDSLGHDVGVVVVVVVAEDGIAVGEEDGAREVGVVGGGAGGPGEKAPAGQGLVGAGMEGVDDGVRLEFKGCAEGVAGVEGEESTEGA